MKNNVLKNLFNLKNKTRNFIIKILYKNSNYY